jgi:ankyrin repeat protein
MIKKAVAFIIIYIILVYGIYQLLINYKLRTKFYNLTKTDLMIACSLYQREKALALIDESAYRLDTSDISGNTALMLACKNNLSEVALKIIKKYSRRSGIEKYNIYSETPFFLSCKQQFMSQDVPLFIIKCMPYESDMGRVNINGDTALIWACCNNKAEVVEKMIINYYDICNPGNISNKKYTAFLFACTNGMSNIVDTMIKYPKIFNITFTNNSEYLHCLFNKNIQGQAIDYIKKYNNELNLRYINNLGQTLLSVACINKSPLIALHLLSTYPDKCNIGYVDNSGSTELSWACQYNLKPIIYVLLSQYSDKYDLSLSKIYGTTIFSNLLSNKNEKAAVYMIRKHFDDCIVGTGIFGTKRELITYAMQLGLDKVVLAWISENNKRNKKIELKSEYLYTACKNDMFIIVKILLDKYKSNNKINNLHITELITKSNKMFNLIMKYLNKEEKIQLMLTNNKADILKEMIHVPDFDQSINTICQFKKLRDSMSEQIRSTTDCIICFEETDDTYINSCGHVMSVCTECLDPYKNTKKCAVCKTSLSLQKCFVV